MPDARRPGATFWLAILLAAAAAAHQASAADWPQFMRDASHTGDAADEALAIPLGLLAQVRLDDAAMTSPAVVDGLAYVVDQMGTAYCVDPRAGRIVWKVSPDGAKAMGSNTSSPCVGVPVASILVTAFKISRRAFPYSPDTSDGASCRPRRRRWAGACTSR